MMGQLSPAQSCDCKTSHRSNKSYGSARAKPSASLPLFDLSLLAFCLHINTDICFCILQIHLCSVFLFVF